jgi:hypothetical protein
MLEMKSIGDKKTETKTKVKNKGRGRGKNVCSLAVN